MNKHPNNSPIVSVAMLAYNHEKYIKQALDSVLMQNVNFIYEIVVGEDCSTDNTRVILLEYKKRFPDKINLILHEKNVGMHNNSVIVRRACRGKYRANCEGDDYWTDPYKLQKQVDFLESHPEYIGTAHKVQIVDEHGRLKSGGKWNYCKDKIYTIKHAEKGIMCGHTSSRVYRNILRDDPVGMESLAMCSAIGDVKMSVYLALNGNVFCFDEVMSHYRWVPHVGGSWSARNEGKNKNLVVFKQYKEIESMALKLKNIKLHFRIPYLNCGLGAFVIWLRNPTKENHYILMEIFRKYNNRVEMGFFILVKIIPLAFMYLIKLLKSKLLGIHTKLRKEFKKKV